MNLRLLVRTLLNSMRRDGLGGTLRKATSRLVTSTGSAEFDRKHGTDTSGIEPLWKLKIQSPNASFGVRYEATTEHELVSALEFLSEDLREFTFVDLGCGKGRTLLIASQLGFKEIIGVEFALELVQVAQANLAKMNVENATVLHQDAADFRFPATATVLYLYNPFSREVAERVVSNLSRAGLRKLYVIYKRPECADLLDASDFLQRLGSPSTAPHMHIWSERR